MSTIFSSQRNPTICALSRPISRSTTFSRISAASPGTLIVHATCPLNPDSLARPCGCHKRIAPSKRAAVSNALFTSNIARKSAARSSWSNSWTSSSSSSRSRRLALSFGAWDLSRLFFGSGFGGGDPCPLFAGSDLNQIWPFRYR